MKRLLIGPAGSGKTHLILDEFENYLHSADPLTEDAFVVLPSAEHTDRILTLILQRGIRGFFFRRITTLSHLVSDVFVTGAERFASNATRFIILKEILSRPAWSYFQVVQQTPGFLNLMLSFVAELKEAFIGPELFRSRMNEMKRCEADLASKYEALAGIYEAYQKALEERGLLDRQDVLRIAREKNETLIPRRRFKRIWLDGFFDFSNLQMEYLKELMNITEDMTISLTCEQPTHRLPLFEALYPTFEKLKALGFEVVEQTGASRRTQNAELQYLQKNLFKDPDNISGLRPVSRDEISLQLFESVGIQGEIEMIAREILRLYRLGNYRFSDFAILFRQIAGYEPVIRSLFERYEIPVEIHERERLDLSPIIETIRALLFIFLEGWKREDLLNFLKSSYVRILDGVPKSYEWVSELENFSYQEGIMAGRSQWLGDWHAQGQIPSGWNEKKRRWLQPLADLEDLLQKAQTFEEIKRLIWNALTLKFKIFIPSDEYSEAIRREAASMQRLEALFEEIHHQLTAQGHTAVTFQEFAEYLLRLIEIDLYSLHERNANRVQVYDISLARQKEYKVVFVAGLLERSFPVHIQEDPILSDWERQLFNYKADFSLSEKLPRQNLERYLFYLAVSRAQEKLILSCPRLDLEGKESLPSFYLEEVQRLFDHQLAKKKQDLSHPYPALEEVVSLAELETSVMGELWHPHPRMKEQGDFLLYLLNQILESPSGKEKFTQAFQEIRSEIKDPEILKRSFFRAERTSATSLEDYAKCPYKYFARRVLKLKDPHEEVNIKLKGIIRHQVLENYFKQRLKTGAMTWPQTQKLVLTELEKAMKEYPLVAEKKYQRDLYEEELREMLLKFLEKDLAALEGAELQPRYLEFSFGVGEKPDAPPLEMEEEGRKFRVVGKIDRIDVDPKTGSALVVDYKTAAQWSRKQIEFGISLQLPVYLMAVEKFLNFKPIGAQLRFLKTGETKGFYHETHASPYSIFSKKSMLPEEEFRLLLDQSRDYLKRFTREMAEGKIPLMPRLCDAFCPYPAVCRIQKWRLPLILEQIRSIDAQRGQTPKGPFGSDPAALKGGLTPF